MTAQSVSKIKRFFLTTLKVFVLLVLCVTLGLLLTWVYFVAFGDMTSSEYFEVLNTKYVDSVMEKLSGLGNWFGTAAEKAQK